MTDDRPPQGALDDMLADDGLRPADEAALRAALTDIGALANEVPEPSAWVQQMIRGELVLAGTAEAATEGIGQRSARRLGIAVVAGTLAFGGASAAAATNSLPASLQEAVAKATESLPISAPHPKPVKPINPPTDAPGQLKDHSEDDETDNPVETPGDNADAPGQIQKATKPDVADPGPARPADPGSHGRARAAEVQADHDQGGNPNQGPSDDGNHDKKPKKDKHGGDKDH